MDRKKIILIIILVLIVVVYIVFVARGCTTQGEKTSSKDRHASAEKYEPSEGMSNFGSIMGNWFGRFLPKAKISNCPNTPDPKTKIICANLANNELEIPPANASFRVIKVVLESNAANPAHIVYEDTKDKAASEKKKVFSEGQEFDLPDSDHKNVTEQNIIILEKGGKLKISCKGANSNCKVSLQ